MLDLGHPGAAGDAGSRWAATLDRAWFPLTLNIVATVALVVLSPQVTETEFSVLEEGRFVLGSHASYPMAGHWVDGWPLQVLAVLNLPSSLVAGATLLLVEKGSSASPLLSVRQTSWLWAVLWTTFTSLQWFLVGLWIKRRRTLPRSAQQPREAGGRGLG